MDEVPLWVLDGVGGVEDAMRRRRLDATCNSGHGTLDTCLTEVCELNSTSCSCLGALSGQDLGLTGPIPTELGLCDGLTKLWLHKNELNGTIPSELGKLTNLQELRLNNNQLTGPIPIELGNLTNLEILTLGGGNHSNGTIPSELGKLTKLEQLWLNNNELSGAIPTELGNLGNLWQLWLPKNELNGTIPSELVKLTNLQELVLYDNGLWGGIPSELGNLGNLWQLRLDDNQLTGPIPSELGMMTNLKIVRLQENALTGYIPSELGYLTKLEELELYDNQLTGPIPTELGQLTNLGELFVQENCLDTSGFVCPLNCDVDPQDDVDDCGVCRGDNATCADCSGVPYGPLAPGTCGPYDAIMVDLYDIAISIDDSATSLSAFQSNITTIQDDVESVNASLQNGLTAVQGDVDTVNAEITGLTVSIDELLTQMSTMQSRIDELEASRRDSSSSDDNEDVGLYVGIGIGCAGVVGLLIGVIYLLRRESGGSTVQSNDDVFGGGDTRVPTHDI